MAEARELLDLIKSRRSVREFEPVSYTHLDVYKRQVSYLKYGKDRIAMAAR